MLGVRRPLLPVSGCSIALGVPKGRSVPLASPTILKLLWAQQEKAGVAPGEAGGQAGLQARASGLAGLCGQALGARRPSRADTAVDGGPSCPLSPQTLDGAQSTWSRRRIRTAMSPARPVLCVARCPTDAGRIGGQEALWGSPTCTHGADRHGRWAGGRKGNTRAESQAGCCSHVCTTRHAGNGAAVAVGLSHGCHARLMKLHLNCPVCLWLPVQISKNSNFQRKCYFWLQEKEVPANSNGRMSNRDK